MTTNRIHNHATTIGSFNPLRTTPIVPLRPVAYCACGARLSQYRPPQTTTCWACESACIAATPPIELHPPVRDTKPSHHHECPGCGALCHIRAKQCINCRRRGRR